MFPSDQMRLTPWIEALVLRYNFHEEEQEEEAGDGGGGRTLMAHVTGVGNMSASQASASGGPSVLLFLSDGVVQIPAVLSSSAWERLQEEEERESISGLLHSSVALRSFTLRFHPASEERRCRFYLSIGELSTSSAGSSRTVTPCCSSLPSVRVHLLRTYQALQSRAAPHSSHCTFDLSELLEEWEGDHLQGVFNKILNNVREILTTTTTADSPQPSTSTHSAPPSHRATGWDLDRVRYKSERVFKVPVRCLLVPEEEDLQMDVRGDEPAESVQPSVEDADWRISDNIPAERERQISPSPEEEEAAAAGAEEEAEEEKEEEEKEEEKEEEEEEEEDVEILQEETSSGLIDRPLTDPWNAFPPPGVISESSLDSTPTPPLLHHNTTESRFRPPNAKFTSTQILSSKEASFLPPSGQTAACSSSSSPSKPDSEERRIPEAEEAQCRKRKQREESPQAQVTLQEEEEEEEKNNSGSPPSWLFSTQARGSGVEGSENEGSWVSFDNPQYTVPTKLPGVHSDGSSFSYSYQASGTNLEDFARLRVPGTLLQWAVKYLLSAKRTEDSSQRLKPHTSNNVDK